MEFDMVFEGGGAKGMVFVGSLQALEAQGHTAGRLVGTSAGAITATLLSIGYTSSEMKRALEEKDANGEPMFASFMDKPTLDDFTKDDINQSVTKKFFQQINIPLVPEKAEDWVDEKIIRRLLNLKAYPTLFSFVERGGLYVGKAFLAWFRDRLDEKGPYSTLTLAQLHSQPGRGRGRDLSLVATDTSARQMLVLNHRTAPNCPVAWAVRMSMSIPFAWHEVRWESEWDPYQTFNDAGTELKSETNLAGHCIVDGGALSNFPINMLTSDEPSVRAVMGDTVPNRDAVLGLLIDEELEVEGAPPPPDTSEDDDAGVAGNIKKLRTVQRVFRLIDTMSSAHDKQLIAANEDLICRVPAKTYGTMEFDMTDERKERLIDGGRKAMEKHLEGR